MVPAVREVGVVVTAAAAERAEEGGMAEGLPGEADGTADAVEDGRVATLAGAGAAEAVHLLAEVTAGRAGAEAAGANKSLLLVINLAHERGYVMKTVVYLSKYRA
jgi:hypothetical protein